MMERPFPPGDRRSLVLTADLPDEDHAQWVEAAALFSPEIAVARVRGESRFQAVQRLKPDLVVAHGRCFDADPTPGFMMTWNRHHRGHDLDGALVNDVAPVLERELRRLGREHHQGRDAAPDGRAHVLMVDDELPLLSSYNRVLRRYRQTFRISFATTGIEGLERIRSDRPDVVVTNLNMPFMSGAKMIDIIRRDETLRGLFIIIASGGRLMWDDPPLEALEPELELSKPVPISTLRHAIALGVRHTRGLEIDGIPLPPYVA